MARLAAKEKALFYPTPLAIIELIISNILSNGNGPILDPCCGTGEPVALLGQRRMRGARLPLKLSALQLTQDAVEHAVDEDIALAGTGVGKSLFMCHMAAAGLMMNKNVLYITLEMSEERIAERIDANVMNIPMKDLPDLSKKMFDKKVDKVRSKTQGKLIIKEYPTASAHVGHFRHLLQELELKKDFTPDMIFIDYLNICASARVKPGAGANSYTLVKSIAEELRGLAVEFDVPIMSATQTTRSGYGSTDVELTDTSESFGLPATADFMFALISSEELEELDQMVVKQLKNRYNDTTVFKRFVIGVDRSRMKLYDCEQEAQEDLHDGTQLIDDSIPVADRGRSEKFNDFKF